MHIVFRVVECGQFEALLHESSLARTMSTDRILLGGLLSFYYREAA